MVQCANIVYLRWSMPRYIEKIIKQDFIKLASENNIDNITVTKLLEPSGINRKTFYNHFSGISDLICSIFLDLNDNTALFLYDNIDWKSQIQNAMKFLLENKAIVKKVVSSRYNDDIQRFFKEHLTVTVKTFVKDFCNKANEKSGGKITVSAYEEEKIVYLYLPLIDALIKQWFRSGMKEPISEYTDTIEKLTVGGIFDCISYFSKSN